MLTITCCCGIQFDSCQNYFTVHYFVRHFFLVTVYLNVIFSDICKEMHEYFRRLFIAHNIFKIFFESNTFMSFNLSGG